MVCFSFCSLGQIQTADFTFNFTTLGFASEGIPTDGAQEVTSSTWYFFAVSIMSALIPLIAIFCFRNLQLQKRLCIIEVIFLVAVAAVGGILGYCSLPGEISWSTVIICPLLAVILDIIAYRYIRSDEKKLRAVDRFRD